MVALFSDILDLSGERSPIPILGEASQFRLASCDQRIVKLVDQLRRSLLMHPDNSERLHVIFLDRRRSWLGEKRFENGTSSAFALRMRDLFSQALSLGASGIILAHNHPSGVCRPSQRDVEATRCVAGIAQALEIELLDHLIFTHSAVYSMRARGEL